MLRGIPVPVLAAAPACLALAAPARGEETDSGDPSQGEKDLAEGLVIAAQSDTHGYNRVPKEYLEGVLRDLPRAHADLFFLLGDLVGPGTVMSDVARTAPVPALFSYGDHEDFEEWGHVFASGPVPPMRDIGGHAYDPFNFMRARASSWQGSTGLPYGWSFTYRNVHVVIVPSCKTGGVVPFWFLEWLQDDLERSKDKTTVVVSHRGFFERGERGSAERFNDLLKRFPQVKLLLYGHYHGSRPPRRWGEADGVMTEVVWPGKADPGQATFQGRYYVVATITPGAVRTWVRYPDTGKMILLTKQRVATTVTPPGEPVQVRLPYLLAAGCRASLPVLKLRDPKLRVWGVQAEQLVPNALLEKESIPWQAAGTARLRIAREGNDGFPVDRTLGIHLDECRGSARNPAAVASLSLSGIRFATRPIEIAGADLTYTLLAMVKAPARRNVWLVVDTLLPDGEVEASYTRKLTIGDAATPQFQLLRLNSMWLDQLNGFRWCPGPKGREGEMEVTVDHGRGATALRITLATPDRVSDEEWRVAFFVYTGGGFFTALPEGRSFTRGARVTVGSRAFGVEALPEGERREWALPDLLGGTPLALPQCEGSRTAVVELEGEVDALQTHRIRHVTEPAPGRFVLGEACEGTPPAGSPLGVTVLQLFRPGRIGLVPVVARQNNHQVVEGGAEVTVSPEERP